MGVYSFHKLDQMQKRRKVNTVASLAQGGPMPLNGAQSRVSLGSRKVTLQASTV